MSSFIVGMTNYLITSVVRVMRLF